MSTNSDTTEKAFEDQLQELYDQHRRQHLEDELESLAQAMEETLLQQAIAETFFDETIHIDEEVKETVSKTVEKLNAKKYDDVEATLETLTTQVDKTETRVTNRIQKLRIERQETVSAMRRLNERVDRVDGTKLEALETLLEDWEWKPQVYLDTHDSFEEYEHEARQYGETMAAINENLTEELFGVYDDTELKPLVDKLLDDEPLQFGALSPEERQQLTESDLADYIELKLS